MKLHVLPVAMALLVISACDDTGPFAGKSLSAGFGTTFQERYFAAREDLEDGNFNAAARKYRGLSSEFADSDLAARLDLELAHALLRGGDYAEAAEVSTSVMRGAQGPLRGLALAVHGTARHEMAKAKGNPADFAAAEAALSDMIENYPDLDRGGAMARRLSILRSGGN